MDMFMAAILMEAVAMKTLQAQCQISHRHTSPRTK